MEEDWQNSLASLKDRNMHLLRSGIRSDCCFLVGIEAENRESIKAHKFIICVASLVFERMFYGSIPENGDQPILVDDIEAEDFKNMLHFIYTFEMEIKSTESAQKLYYAAEKYNLKPLKEKCIGYLSRELNPANVLEVFEWAKIFDQSELEQKCLQVLRNKTSEVLKSEKFLLAHPSTLDAIVSQDELDIEDEWELFKALENYAKHHRQLASVDVAVDSAESAEVTAKDDILEDILSDLQQIAKKIRFLCMTCEQFAADAINSILLDRNDAYQILACIAYASNEREHFPPGFTNSRINRCWDMPCAHGNYEKHSYTCPGGILYMGKVEVNVGTSQFKIR